MAWKMTTAIVVGVLSLVIAACATGVKGSPRRICYDAGYQPGTAEFSNCWKSVRNEMFKSDAAAIGIGAAAAVANNRRRSVPIPGSGLTANQWQPGSSGVGAGSSIWLCPDGSYVFGRGCFIAPDGTFVGATPQIAPDGRWLGGTPYLAPNGRYVAGPGPVITICPDGTYVAAPRCQLMPDGTYLGVR